MSRGDRGVRGCAMRRARVGRRRARARRNIGTEGLRVVVEAPKGIKSLEKAREDLATTATPTARTTRTKAPKANVASIFRFVAFARDEDDARGVAPWIARPDLHARGRIQARGPQLWKPRLREAHLSVRSRRKAGYTTTTRPSHDFVGGARCSRASARRAGRNAASEAVYKKRQSTTFFLDCHRHQRSI